MKAPTLAWISILSIAAALFLPACGSDDQDTGQAPTISDLTTDPSTIAVGTTSTIHGHLTFQDPDADITKVELDVRPPGATEAVHAGDIEVDASQSSGQLNALIVFDAPAAGDYTFFVVAVDAKGHRSNQLEAMIHAQ